MLKLLGLLLVFAGLVSAQVLVQPFAAGGGGAGDIEGVTAGAGIGGGGTSGTVTVTLDLATLVASQVIFDGASASRTLTVSLSGATDPVFTFSDALINISTGALQVGGVAVVTTTGTQTLTNKSISGGQITSTVGTATSLADNGANCSAGQFPLGIDGFGAVETCTALPTTITGTANEITSSASTGAITLSLPTAVDLGGKTSFEVPNAAAPSTTVFGQIAGDNNAWAGSRGAIQWFDGTANVYIVGVLATDVPTNGQVPVWLTGGTIEWQSVSAAAAGSDTQVQFNDGGTNLGGDAGLVYNKTTDALTVLGAITAASITVSGTEQGVVQILEDSANGSNYRAWSVPDALTQNLTLRLPDGDPADSFLVFPAPTTAISQGAYVAGSGTGSVVRATSPTITTPTISGAIAFPDGTRQSFNPDATTPGFNVGSQAGDPSTLSNGDKWYNSTSNKFRCRENGATVDCIGAGSGDSVSVNGTAATDADLDDATPAAATIAGGSLPRINATWQKDSGTPNNISAAIPLGGFDPAVSHMENDEFTCGSDDSANVGCLDWKSNTNGTGGHFSALPAESTESGIVQLNTGSATGNTTILSSHNIAQVSIHSAATWRADWKVRASTNDANTVLRVGMNCTSTLVVDEPTAGIYFQKAAADTTWRAVTRSASTSTTTDTTVTITSGFMLLTLLRSDASTIKFYVDGTERASHTATIPSAGCNWWAMIDENGTAAAKTFDIGRVTRYVLK